MSIRPATGGAGRGLAISSREYTINVGLNPTYCKSFRSMKPYYLHIFMNNAGFHICSTPGFDFYGVLKAG